MPVTDLSQIERLQSQMRQCKADGCFKYAKGFSSWCDHHRRNLARHGHPHQQGIKKADLKPYRKVVREYLEKLTSRNPQGILEEIWKRTVDEAQSFIKYAQQGQPYNRHELQAYRAIVALAEQQDGLKVGETLIAMGYWLEFDPSFWRHDNGFRYQTVRMLLRLNPKEAAYNWHDGNMTRSVYRDVPPRTIEHLWAMVEGTGLIGYGVEMARREAKTSEIRRQRTQAEREAFFGRDAEVTQ
jgi:hypothetical protein